MQCNNKTISSFFRFNNSTLLIKIPNSSFFHLIGDFRIFPGNLKPKVNFNDFNPFSLFIRSILDKREPAFSGPSTANRSERLSYRAVLLYNNVRLHQHRGIAIRKSLPGAAVRKFLLEHKPSGRILLLSVGKAAEEMAQAAYEVLQSQIFEGIILTKYGHSSGKKFPPLEILEAGHPIPDANSILGGTKILELCSHLQPEDIALVLLSGGGSTLMEVPAPGAWIWRI